MFSPIQNILTGEYTIFIRCLIMMGLFIQALGTLACGAAQSLSRLQGGTEVGNPPSAYRQIVGTVPETAAWQADSSLRVAGDCLGSQVQAKLDGATVALGNVDFECQFSLWVESDSNYSFQLRYSSEAGMPIVFVAPDGGFDDVIDVEFGDAPIAWGQLNLALDNDEWVAFPSVLEPTEASDVVVSVQKHRSPANLSPESYPLEPQNSGPDSSMKAAVIPGFERTYVEYNSGSNQYRETSTGHRVESEYSHAYTPVNR